MRHTGFKYLQKSSSGRFLPGGKLGFIVRSKSAICRFVHGCIFIQWINFELLSVAKFLTFRKSFETGTYNNAKNASTNHPSTKTISKNCPLDKLPAAEGVFENISHWIIPKNNTQPSDPNQRGCTSVPAWLKEKNGSRPIFITPKRKSNR